MPSKNYTLFFILSVGFVILSIAFITILGQTSKDNSTSTDIRAKAGVANALRLQGTVASYNPSEKTFVITNVKFAGDNGEGTELGDWTVTQPEKDFIPSSVISGNKVIIAIDSATFDTASRTVQALAVSAQ